jgi:hypothetical protein
MATQQLRPIKAKRRRSGGPVLIKYFPEAASQTFKAGEAVYLVSGKITEFTDSVDDGSTRFLGFAAEDASGVTDQKVGVYVADDDLVFEGNIYHGTEASAITALTDVGSSTLLPLKILANQGDGMVAVDKENTASKIDCVRIVKIPLKPGEAVGDTYGRVEFIIEAAGRQISQ